MGKEKKLLNRNQSELDESFNQLLAIEILDI